MILRVKLLREGAKFDSPRKPGDVGYDLSACIDEELILGPHETRVIPSGIALIVPEGHMGEVRPRSGLASSGLVAEVGSIDQGYRGEVGVILSNRRDSPTMVVPGMRIAQLVLVRVSVPEVAIVEELGATVRGESGFGSSGVA